MDKWLDGAQTRRQQTSNEQECAEPRRCTCASISKPWRPWPVCPSRPIRPSGKNAALQQARAGRIITEIRPAPRRSNGNSAWRSATRCKSSRPADVYGERLNFGRLAAKHLQRADPAGRQLPDHDFLVGWLFYRLVAIHAIGRKNHKQALAYYGPAVKLLGKPVPPSAWPTPGRHGETFVSIAVSYWETGDHDEAIRLTKQGVKLMEQAVDEGPADQVGLAVPYGNLANMHSELGDKQAELLAAKIRPKLRPRQAASGQDPKR